MSKEKDNLQETVASDSIVAKGDAKTAYPSKVKMMSSMMGMMNGMTSDDMTKFFDAVMAQFGPNKEYGVGDNSASNAASISMKPSAATVKEDLNVIFDGEEISEEFKGKFNDLFEAAVETRLIAEVARIEEEKEVEIKEQIQTFTEELVNKVDSYLDYVVEKWMEENEVAITSTLQSEITEDFIKGLKGLFEEHYISVPEEKIDVVEQLAEKQEKLEKQLDEVLEENYNLKAALLEEKAVSMVEDISSDLALTQKEKFYKIVEGVEFDGDLEVFERKLSTIKETYFGEKNTSTSTNINEESFEGEEVTDKVSYDPVVNKYAEAISRTIKK